MGFLPCVQRTNSVWTRGEDRHIAPDWWNGKGQTYISIKTPILAMYMSCVVENIVQDMCASPMSIVKQPQLPTSCIVASLHRIVPHDQCKYTLIDWAI